MSKFKTIFIYIKRKQNIFCFLFDWFFVNLFARFQFACLLSICLLSVCLFVFNFDKKIALAFACLHKFIARTESCVIFVDTAWTMSIFFLHTFNYEIYIFLVRIESIAFHFASKILLFFPFSMGIFKTTFNLSLEKF